MLPWQEAGPTLENSSVAMRSPTRMASTPKSAAWYLIPKSHCFERFVTLYQEDDIRVGDLPPVPAAIARRDITKSGITGFIVRSESDDEQLRLALSRLSGRLFLSQLSQNIDATGL